MKMILRKEDSAASILLFIYRFNESFKKEAVEGLMLSSILKAMRLFDKNESAVRMALSRALKSGLFENCRKGNEVYYFPTGAGKIYLRTYENEVESFIRRLQLRNSQWDGMWHVLSLFYPLDILSDKKKALVKNLQRFGFAKISGDVWISPYNMSEELLSIQSEFETICTNCMFQGEMTIKNDIKGFTEKLFKTNELMQSYRDFINHYEVRLEALEETINTGHPIESDFAIPLYYEIGLSFFNFSLNDPLLPKELLPEWEGDKAASIMMKIIGILVPCVKSYFESIQ